MRTVSASEARQKLSQLLGDVERGEVVSITRRGRPVARLTPVRSRSRADVAAAIQAWEAYRAEQNITLGGLSIRELMDEGRM